MAHEIRANLTNLKELANAVKELAWYTGDGGYLLTGVTTSPEGSANWTLESRPPAPEKSESGATSTAPSRAGGPNSAPGRRLVEPGDRVVVETKGQQMTRRFGGGLPDGVEGDVFRVLTRGPHPHGMKVELRDRTVGRIKRNLTAPGAGEPTGR